MRAIDGSPIDLNLLSALEALLAEGSVTGAARRLGVGQPAASHALARLRVLFEDPLFVRAGRSIVPTPRAEALREPLTRVLAGAARLLAGDAGFVPARAKRAFVIACPDLLAPAIPRLVARLREQAPHARLEIQDRRADDPARLEDGRLDAALGPAPEEGPGLVRRGLGAVRFAVASRRGHPAVKKGEKLSRARWAAYPHVMVRTGHGGKSLVGGELVRAGFHRTVGLVVPTFLSALVAVGGSDLFFTGPRALMAPLADPLGLAFSAPPVPLAPVPVALVWHERFHSDPASRFFRGLVQDALEGLLRVPTA